MFSRICLPENDLLLITQSCVSRDSGLASRRNYLGLVLVSLQTVDVSSAFRDSCLISHFVLNTCFSDLAWSWEFFSMSSLVPRRFSNVSSGSGDNLYCTGQTVLRIHVTYKRLCNVCPKYMYVPSASLSVYTFIFQCIQFVATATKLSASANACMPCSRCSNIPCLLHSTPFPWKPWLH